MNPLRQRVIDAVRAPAALWALVGVLAVAALGFCVAIGPHAAALSEPFVVPWWVVALGYALAEVLVIHLPFRDRSYSFSLSEIPFVVGLFFLSADELILALALGTAIALVVHRRQSLVKLCFNLASLSFAAIVGLAIFRLLIGLGDVYGVAGWVAAATAAVASDIIAVLLISLAVGIASGGRPREVPRLVVSGAVAALLNTCLALVTVTVITFRPQAAWLPLVLGALMIAAYRIYGSVQQHHQNMEILYESSRRLHQTTRLDEVVETTLRQAHELFRADTAELLLLATADEPARSFRLDARQGSALERSEVVLDPAEGVWARIVSEGVGLFMARPINNSRLQAHYARKGVRDFAVAPLFGRDAVIGTLMAANRVGPVSFGAEDVQLLQAYANHASASLEKADLIGRLRSQASESEHRALHDALTELPNRTSFREEIARRIATGSGEAFAVALMDLNKFKEVNDTLGHGNGDLLLQAVAARLSENATARVVVARLGGDEFGLLIDHVMSAQDATARIAELTSCLAAPIVVQELSLEVDASTGICLYPAHGRDADTLIQRADVAMYDAKASFLPQVLYDATRDMYSQDRLALIGDLRRTIEGGELIVVYQPKVDVGDGRVVGAEALVRWYHPLRGNVPADEFVPIAEQTGLLRPLTEFVLATAVAQCAHWRTRNPDFMMAVNLSVRNLLDTELPVLVERLITDHRLPPEALELEVTESALIADPVRAHGVLHRLRALGVGLSIDDYGTGYSSLAYIRRMPINELKIDKSFVIGMADDENDALIVASTIDLGHKLGLRVVAEGVETKAAWRRLAELDCDLAQGFLFGAPQTATAFTRMLSRRPDARVATRRDRRAATPASIATLPGA